jgi:hypothetical protein
MRPLQYVVEGIVINYGPVRGWRCDISQPDGFDSELYWNFGQRAVVGLIIGCQNMHSLPADLRGREEIVFGIKTVSQTEVIFSKRDIECAFPYFPDQALDSFARLQEAFSRPDQWPYWMDHDGAFWLYQNGGPLVDFGIVNGRPSTYVAIDSDK